MKTQIVAQPNSADFQIVRQMPYSVEKVFKAYSEPALYGQWYMPNMNIQKMDCKTEGCFHHTHLMPDGSVCGFKGVYHEVIANQKIIRTSEFFGLPQKLIPNIEITTFIPIDVSSTQITIHTICPSTEIRDAMISHGMQAALSQQDLSLAQLLNNWI